MRSADAIVRILAVLTALIALASCDEFFTKNIQLGGNVPSLASSSSSSGGSGGDDSDEGPVDDDDDGLSNEVERTFGIEIRKADSDHDGFADGLEFVGRLGDPLNARLSPTSFGRERILVGADIILDSTDSDLDGLGDLAEAARSLNANSPDTDEDGYIDSLELVAGSNPSSASSRPQRASPPLSDGLTRNGVPPADRDGDGIADDIESLNGGSSDSRDSDSDGFADGIEFIMGSDASDEASIPDFTANASAAQFASDGLF